MKTTLITLALVLPVATVAAGPYLSPEKKARLKIDRSQCKTHKDWVLDKCQGLPGRPASILPEQIPHQVVTGDALDKQFEKSRAAKQAFLATQRKQEEEKKREAEALRQEAEDEHHANLLNSLHVEDRMRSKFWSEQWEDEFQVAQMEARAALRDGGTFICFYDLWKLTPLADAMKAAGFQQLRFIEWLKLNPVPLNSKRNYLTNAREMAVSAIKGGRPTFHGEYHNGLYTTGIPRNRNAHPTAKPVNLMKDLVARHSNEGDLVIDPFLGSGAIGVAATSLGRRFIGGDIDTEYAEKASLAIDAAWFANSAI